LESYLRHLRSQRNLAAHTVRAYRTDLLNLFTHLDRLGIESLDNVELRALRSWLAKQHTLGQARATLQRRAAAARCSSPGLTKRDGCPRIQRPTCVPEDESHIAANPGPRSSKPDA
jgi:integrase/recombinase XerC